MRDINGTFIFKMKRETVRIYCDDIVLFESSGHYIDIHMQNGEVCRMRSTMSALGKMLDENCFIQVHRGIVVNLKYVRAIHKNDVMLDGIWKSVPVSRSCKELLAKAFDAFRAKYLEL